MGRTPVAAAVLENPVIGKEAMGWFRVLNAPRMQLPLPASGVVGAIYYLELGAVLYRAHRNDDRRVRRVALLVLTVHELWNVSFFGRRDPRAGFLGMVAFLAPLLALQRAVSSGRPSVLAPTPYPLWVIGYDLPWTYSLWRLHRVAPR